MSQAQSLQDVTHWRARSCQLLPHRATGPFGLDRRESLLEQLQPDRHKSAKKRKHLGFHYLPRACNVLTATPLSAEATLWVSDRGPGDDWHQLLSAQHTGRTERWQQFMGGFELGVLVSGCLLAPISLLAIVTAVLELLVILGPVGKCTTWWPHNVLMLILWVPHLGVSGWQLQQGLAIPTIPFIAIGAFFIVTHMLLLFCYWLRHVLRKHAKEKELPTQELLTDAQRIMMAAGASDAVGQGVWTYGAGVNHFPMQPGRMDGRDGATVYIPGELQEAIIQDLMIKRGWGAPSPTPGGPQGPTSSGLPRNESGNRAHRQLHSSVQSLRGSQGGLPPSSPSNSGRIGGALISSRSGRHQSESPERSGGGAGLPVGTGPQRGVIQVLLPEALARWNTSGRASNRYKVLTDSALPSPAASVGVGEAGVAGAPVSVAGVGPGVSGSAFAMRAPQVAAAAEGAGAADGNAAARAATGGGMVEASNPLFSPGASLAHELSLRVDSLRSAGAMSSAGATDIVLSSVGTVGMAHVSTTPPSSIPASTPPVTSTTTPTAAAMASSSAWPRATSGLPVSRENSMSSRPTLSPEMSAARLSLDPSLVNIVSTPTSNQANAQSSDWRNGMLWRLGKQSQPMQPHSARADESAPASVDWEREFGVQSTTSNNNGSVLLNSSLPDPGSRSNLLDAGHSHSSSAAPALGLVSTPNHSITAGHSTGSQHQHSGTTGSAEGAGSGARGSGNSKGGGGLLGGRLASWRAQHTRNHSFPLASSLTAALLQDQDSSGDVAVSPDGPANAGTFVASPRHQQQQQPGSATAGIGGGGGLSNVAGLTAAPPSPSWHSTNKKL